MKKLFRLILAIFALSTILLIATPNTKFSLLFFTFCGAVTSVFMLTYGLNSYKERKYVELLRGGVKTGQESKKPSATIIIFSLALSMFLYNFYTREVLYLRMQKMFLDAESLQSKSN